MWPPVTVAHLRRCGGSISDLTPPARDLVVSLVLGSKSASRKGTLDGMALTYTVVPADLDERALGDRTDGANPEVLVKLLAETKGAAVVGALKAGKAAAGVPGCTCVLTGDQVVVHDGTILEKPVDADEARRFIAAYSGGECTTVGSCTATDPATGVQFTVVEVATLVFEEIPDLTTVTAMLITEGEIFYCAGALMAENPLLVPHIKEVKGTIDAVLGLSPRAVCEALNGLAAAIQPAP